MKLCTHCQQQLTSPLVCLGCGALLEIESGAPLSPFEILRVPEDWSVDPKQLKRQLLKLSRAVHPDFFATADEDTQRRAESASAALNAAYENLRDDFSRADWLVTSRGGPSESEDRQMPQVFLMQVLEWNETLDQAREAAQESAEWIAMRELGKELVQEREKKLASITALLTPLPEAGAASLSDARRELNAMRYIDRTLSEIKKLQLKASLGSH